MHRIRLLRERERGQINGGGGDDDDDIACSQGEGRHIHTNCNRSLCKRASLHVKWLNRWSREKSSPKGAHCFRFDLKLSSSSSSFGFKHSTVLLEMNGAVFTCERICSFRCLMMMQLLSSLSTAWHYQSIYLSAYLYLSRSYVSITCHLAHLQHPNHKLYLEG